MRFSALPDIIHLLIIDVDVNASPWLPVSFHLMGWP